jgi:beta-glucuronidase
MKIVLFLKISLFLAMIHFMTGVSGSVNSMFVYYRDAESLDGKWNIIIDPYDNGYCNYRQEPFDQMNQPWATGYFGDIKPKSPGDLIEYNYDRSPALNVPGDWNTQDSILLFYEGSVWYRKKFDAPHPTEEKRVFLYFGAVNYRADVYLNAKKLGTHIGGFTPFWFEVTGLLKEKDNSLIVRVNNIRLKEGVPTLNTDWWNYGGITRDVKMIEVPDAFINDYSIALNSASTKKIVGKVYVDGGTAGEKVTITIPELNIKATSQVNEKGEANFDFVARNAILWTPESPRLYRIEISSGIDQLIDSIGFRTIAVKGKQILLNDKPIFLKGISVHEEYAVNGEGRVNAAWKARQLLSWAKELNCNFVRLAHYPHNEDMIRVAEQMGIMVWSEVPVYWTINWENEETYLNAKKQLEDNILRDRNRVNIIIWSLANETPVNDARNLFLSKLAQHARKLDSTRLLSAAMEKHYLTDSLAVVEDPLANVVDIVAFNEYIGWYDGLPDKCNWVNWKIPYDKPIFISEFGGGAKYGYHGNKNERWTEEFQEDLYRQSLPMMDQINGLCGMSPWILIDFRSPRRPLPDIQDYFNRKGLLSEKGEKKKAFFVLRQYYEQKTY